MAYYTKKFKLHNRKEPSYKRKWQPLKKSFKRKRRNIFKVIWKRFHKAFYFLMGFVIILLIIGSIYVFGYLQSITEQLPSPDKPFGEKNAASEIFDRNGKLLYRVYGNENRDPVTYKDTPVLLRWSILAAEDIDFYNHSG